MSRPLPPSSGEPVVLPNTLNKRISPHLELRKTQSLKKILKSASNAVRVFSCKYKFDSLEGGEVILKVGYAINPCFPLSLAVVKLLKLGFRFKILCQVDQ